MNERISSICTNVPLVVARRELMKKIEKLSGQMTSEDFKIRQMRRQKLKRGKRARLKYGDVELRWKEKN